MVHNGTHPASSLLFARRAQGGAACGVRRGPIDLSALSELAATAPLGMTWQLARHASPTLRCVASPAHRCIVAAVASLHRAAACTVSVTGQALLRVALPSGWALGLSPDPNRAVSHRCIVLTRNV